MFLKTHLQFKTSSHASLVIRAFPGNSHPIWPARSWLYDQEAIAVLKTVMIGFGLELEGRAIRQVRVLYHKGLSTLSVI